MTNISVASRLANWKLIIWPDQISTWRAVSCQRKAIIFLTLARNCGKKKVARACLANCYRLLAVHGGLNYKTIFVRELCRNVSLSFLQYHKPRFAWPFFGISYKWRCSRTQYFSRWTYCYSTYQLSWKHFSYDMSSMTTWVTRNTVHRSQSIFDTTNETLFIIGDIAYCIVLIWCTNERAELSNLTNSNSYVDIHTF